MAAESGRGCTRLGSAVLRGAAPFPDYAKKSPRVLDEFPREKGAGTFLGCHALFLRPKKAKKVRLRRRRLQSVSDLTRKIREAERDALRQNRHRDRRVADHVAVDLSQEGRIGLDSDLAADEFFDGRFVLQVAAI